jgi:Ca2+-binding RTX toxin-like protein
MAQVTITVTEVNDAPVAVDDAFTTIEDTPLTVTAPGVLDNDTDPDGDALTALLVASPANGTLTLNADGSFTYTPEADFIGADNFTYRANDGTTDSGVAVVILTVSPANRAPVAVDDAFTTPQDTPLTVAAPGVLANDTDVDGDTLTALLVTGPEHGIVQLAADGGFTYTPDEGYVGPDSFTYRAGDGLAQSETATVALTVTPLASVDVVNGTDGADRIIVQEANGVITVTLNGITQTIARPEDLEIFGLGGDDRIEIIGLTIDIFVDAGAGNDIVDASGHRARATLLGGDGDDTLRGGAGRDDLAPGTGRDTADGGAGDDTFQWAAGDGEDVWDGGEGIDAAVVTGSAGADRFTVQANGSRVSVLHALEAPAVDPDMIRIEELRIAAEGGADRVIIGDLTGTDLKAVYINAGAGNDFVDASRLNADVRLAVLGGAGNDQILGGRGHDVLLGGEGTDVVDGGQGTNLLLGGAGNDTVRRGVTGHVTSGPWRQWLVDSADRWKDGQSAWPSWVNDFLLELGRPDPNERLSLSPSLLPGR